MKIILAHYKYYIQGGPERYMFKFMELAKKHGCEVIPFSVNYSTNVSSEYSKYFVTARSDRAEFSGKGLSPLKAVHRITSEFHNKEAYNKIKKLIFILFKINYF